jgi:hypothetical protein
MSSGHSALIWVQKSPEASAVPLPLAAAPPLAAAAAEVAAGEVELLLLVVELLHAESTNASAPTPAMVAVNFLAGL